MVTCSSSALSAHLSPPLTCTLHTNFATLSIFLSFTCSSSLTHTRTHHSGQCITSCELNRKDLILVNVIQPKTKDYPSGFLASCPDRVTVCIHWQHWGEASILEGSRPHY
mmetsp:Transcript_80775/g.118497  ORF Transcript_80775/g.118497 Transcript_80775/m.118497 type:complete len:110 (+) Transcript_80775:259-588(+)